MIEGKEERVYTLKKALYGLKQAPRIWYGEIDGYFNGKGFQKSKNEPTLHGVLIVSLYINDLVFTLSDSKLVEDFKNEMTKKYDMSNLGLLHYFLGIEIYQKGDDVFMCQRKYAKTLSLISSK